MEDDFVVETISVELALQRELAYRKKLALELGPDDDLLKNLVPLQDEQSSIPSPVSDRPSSSTSSLPTKRKEPPKSANEPQTTTIITNLRCKVCSVDCSSPLNLDQHLRGHKHQAKLQELANGQRHWCQVCGISCTDEDCLKMHFEGKRHKAKLLELRSLSGFQGEEIVVAAERQRFYCNVCRVWCIDGPSFQQHLEGKKHKSQLHRGK